MISSSFTSSNMVVFAGFTGISPLDLQVSGPSGPESPGAPPVTTRQGGRRRAARSPAAAPRAPGEAFWLKPCGFHQQTMGERMGIGWGNGVVSPANTLDLKLRHGRAKFARVDHAMNPFESQIKEA